MGRYRVTGTLGRGNFGVVYRGRDDRLHRDVAIKVPSPIQVDRLGGVEAYLKEAQVVAALEHTNIVPVHDVDHTSDGLCYVVFGLIDGSDLRTEASSKARRTIPRRRLGWSPTSPGRSNTLTNRASTTADLKPGNNSP